MEVICHELRQGLLEFLGPDAQRLPPPAFDWFVAAAEASELKDNGRKPQVRLPKLIHYTSDRKAANEQEAVLPTKKEDIEKLSIHVSMGVAKEVCEESWQHSFLHLLHQSFEAFNRLSSVTEETLQIIREGNKLAVHARRAWESHGLSLVPLVRKPASISKTPWKDVRKQFGPVIISCVGGEETTDDESKVTVLTPCIKLPRAGVNAAKQEDKTWIIPAWLARLLQ